MQTQGIRGGRSASLRGIILLNVMAVTVEWLGRYI